MYCFKDTLCLWLVKEEYQLLFCFGLQGYKESGISHPKLKTLFTVVNAPTPLHQCTYSDIATEINSSSVIAIYAAMFLAPSSVEEYI